MPEHPAPTSGDVSAQEFIAEPERTEVAERGPVASIVVPAHDEERTIRRLLVALTTGVPPTTFEIVVVCNGCTDATAEVARQFGGLVSVVEIDQPSKRAALRRGDDVATVFPRVYLDADVEISGTDIERLITPLRREEVQACSPERDLSRAGVHRLARAYYDVWEQLPQVRCGLFGRGVVAVSRTGHERIGALPPMMSDDLVMSEAFAPSERSIVPDARVVVRPARTLRALVNRRVRVATGNTQADRHDLRCREARTSLGGLVRMAAHEPRLVPRMPVFLGVTIAARLRARRHIRSGDFATWLRDATSREIDEPVSPA